MVTPGQPGMGGNIEYGKAVLLRLIDGSRMSREIHIRFQGAGVRLPYNFIA
jgi:hypothetical protein